ncbi:MAG: glycosyltransferase family 4 protein [Candidatus Zixiibacteriota bacterium]
MRILHGPHDYGGAGYKISRAQRKLGHQSDYGSFQTSYFGFPAEYNLQEYRSRFKKASFFLKAVLKYDIFHFHSESLFFDYRDIPLFKKLGKKVIFHFHGSEIRGKKMHPRIKLADAHLVSTPDLLEYVPDGIWIPQPIDLDYWKPLSIEKKEGAVIIIHAPSHRKKKGTDLIISTIEELKREGYPVELSLIEGKSYESLKSYYQKGGIFMDQIIIGTYGNFAVEGMALKKPVCVYIKEEVSPLYPKELPVMNTSLDNLKQNLIKLIEDENLRKELGEKGRAYVEKYHDVQKVALKCLSIYRNC